ncbi:MAG: RHS repeat-associated core domain-containing protein, partial [Rubrivivax sp.]|nr:RHS repeat-associated core domain-containing protein [Rubrivivax sp.]
SEQRYLPFGEIRTDVGTIAQTDFGFTGQRDLGSELGLMDYKARIYSAYINRFLQPDTLIPSPANPQSWNRFSYVQNQPINFSDPTGHIRIQDGNQNDRLRPWSVDKYVPIKRARFDREIGSPPTGGRGYNILDRLAAIEELFNWSLTTPGEMTIYQTPSYPILSGMRVFYQPIYTLNNNSPITIGPTSIGSRSVTLGFNGNFRYKQGLNSISALRIHLPSTLNPQPWALKVSVDTTINTGGGTTFNNRIGVEITARPDNIAYAPAIVYAGFLAYRALQTGQMPSKQELCFGAC